MNNFNFISKKVRKQPFMKRLIALLSLTIFLLISSCNDNKNENIEKDNIIRFWHFWSEPNQRAIIKELINEFEQQNKCKVEMTELSWGDGKTKLFAAFNAKTAPDVLELGSDWVAQFSSAGVLSEIDSAGMSLHKFIDFSLYPSKYNNKFYAVPWVVDTRVLFYNKALVKKDPASFQTFEDVLVIANEINSGGKNYGWGANGSDRHRLYKKIVSFFWTYGGDIFDENSNLVINSEQNVQSLERYASLSRAGIIETQRQLDAAFVEGKVGFWLSGGWLLEKIKNENPNLNFGVTTIPGTKEKAGISFAGGEYLAVSKNSQNQELAQKLIKFLTDGENSIRFCKSVIEAGFPADVNYYNDEFYQTQPNRLIFAKQLENAKMTPVHPKWLDIEAIIEDAAVEVLYGKFSARVALDNAQAKVLEILK